MLQPTWIVGRIEDIRDEPVGIDPCQGDALTKSAIGTDLNGHRGHHIGDAGKKSSRVPKYVRTIGPTAAWRVSLVSPFP